jgi:hypothetical protein
MDLLYTGLDIVKLLISAMVLKAIITFACKGVNSASNDHV